MEVPRSSEEHAVRQAADTKQSRAFLQGVGSVLDICPAPKPIDTYTCSFRELMHETWSRVGADLLFGMKRVKRQKEQEADVG